MPGQTHYTDSVSRLLEDKLGEIFSILDIDPAAGKGVADDGPAFIAAYDSKVLKGGGTVHIPGSVGAGYSVQTPIVLASDVPIVIQGEGPSSVFVRGDDMPAGSGMFDLQNAKKVTFRGLKFDGAVTSPTGLLYSDFALNPAHALLTTNSMFWIHGGEDITFEDCEFTHTGGYSVYLDARTLNISRVKFVNCRFVNNRPHLFGTTAGDLNYGSWTGGIFGQNQATGGATTRVSDLTVRGCTFSRNTGNCVWQHAYGFEALHQRIHVDNNIFEDCGLDGILFGNVVGGSATGNSFRRVGYVTVSDSSASVPKWLAGLNATGLDTSGVVKDVVYANNAFVSVNGGAINGDGFALGSIVGNTMRVPEAGDLEYVEDSIAVFGPGGVGDNWSQGIVLGNTANLDGGKGVTISGNVTYNLGGTAIGLFAGRKSNAFGNIINAPDSPNQPPITLGGVGVGVNQKAFGNVIARNTINYTPAAAAPAVFEDPTYAAFSGEVNFVVGNYVAAGNAFEFQRDPASASGTSESLTTSAVVTSVDRHVMQREGTAGASSAALKFYYQDSSGGYSHVQLQGFYGTGLRGPLLNVSESGVGGVLTTGGRTSSAFQDAVLTGKTLVTGFAAFSDTTYLDAEADLLDGTYSLLRWDSALAKWRQSVTVSAGVRVWSDFSAGGASVAGLDKQVQFNDGGVFGASANFVYDKVTGTLGITAGAGVAGIAVAGGYVQSEQGFAAVGTGLTFNSIQTPNGGVLARNISLTDYMLLVSKPTPTPVTGDDFTGRGVTHFDGGSNLFRFRYGTGTTTLADANVLASAIGLSATAINTVDVSNGGVTGKWLVATDSLFFVQEATPALSGAGQARIYFDSTSHLIMASLNGAAYAPLGGGSDSVAGANTQVQYNNSGAFGASSDFTFSSVSRAVSITTTSGQPGLVVNGGYIDSAQGLVTTSSASNAVQAPNGGMAAVSFTSTRNDEDSHFVMVRSSATAHSYGFNVNNIGYWYVRDRTFGNNPLVIVPNATVALSIVYTSGYFQTDIGLLSTGTSYQSVNVGSGGSYARSHRSTTYTAVGQSAGAPSATSGDSLVDGVIYYDTATNEFKGRVSGSFVSFGGGGSAATYTATATGFTATFQNSNGNFSVNGNGAVVAASSVQGTVVQASNSSTSITFQNTNGNFQVNGNGAVSAAGVISSTGASGGVNVTAQSATNSIQTVGGFNAGSSGGSNGVYQIAGTTVINSSRAFVGSGGVDVGAAGISCGNYNLNGGYIGQTVTFTTSFTQLIFRGGILVSYTP